MSKSLKNFITIREALRDYSPRQLRLLFLMQKWDMRMNYGDESLADACTRERTLKEFFLNINNEVKAAGPLHTIHQTWTDADRALRVAFDEAQARVHAALLDNINYTVAMSEIFSLISTVNKYLAANPAPAAKTLMLKSIAAYVDKMLKVFGVVRDDEAGFLQSILAAAGTGADSAAGAAFTNDVIDRLCGFRDNIRKVALSAAPENMKREIMTACDAFRDDSLPLLGIRLEDKVTGGGVWKLDNAVELVKQIAEKKLGPLVKKTGLKTDLLPKVQQRVKCPSEAFFSSGDNAGKYGPADPATGVPTHDAAGVALEDAARRKLVNVLALAKKSDEVVKRAMAQAKEEDVAVFCAKLEAEIAELQQQYDAVVVERDATIAKINVGKKGPE